MKCSELQLDLSLYSDDRLDLRSADNVRAHLDVCPLCRERLAEYHSVASGLRGLRPVEMPVALRDRIRASARVESTRTHPIIRSSDLQEWITMRLMPFTVGVTASVVIGITFLSMMFSNMPRSGSVSLGVDDRGPVYLASNSEFVIDTGDLITPADYAQTRLGYGYESPSINPQGSLVALTNSLGRGGIKDDEVVVVANVFGNGRARIEEVVEPSRDREAVRELRKALQSDLAHAPFLPNRLEDRPESVRVVLKFQSVNVNTSDPLLEN